jgi:hypothetical protein
MLEIFISGTGLLLANVLQREQSCCIDLSGQQTGYVPLAMYLEDLSPKMQMLQIHLRNCKLSGEHLFQIAWHLWALQSIDTLLIDWCGNTLDKSAIIFLLDCLPCVRVLYFELFATDTPWPVDAIDFLAGGYDYEQSQKEKGTVLRHTLRKQTAQGTSVQKCTEAANTRCGACSKPSCSW